MKTQSKKNHSTRRPAAPFPVGRTAEEYRLHQLSCAYWSNPATRQSLGLPDNETIRRATLSVDRRPGLGMMLSQKVAAYQKPRQKPVKPVVVRPAAPVFGKLSESKLKRLCRRMPADVLELIRAVGAEWNYKLAQMLSRERWEGIAAARHVAMVAARVKFGATLRVLAWWFNRKDHTTVAHAARHVHNKMEIDPAFRARVLALAARLGVQIETENQTAMKEESRKAGNGQACS